MSSTTGKKVTKASPTKTQKRSSRKKTAKAAPRKSRRSSMVTRKKAAKKKSAVKKIVPKKKSAGKTSKKAASTQREKARSRKQASTAPETEATGDTKSLSWMSARAASALKAVKASQAEKGQTLLAKTRKQAAEALIDDESLIKIAAEMPADNEGLLEFTTEQPLDEQPLQTDTGMPALTPATDETHTATDEGDEAEPITAPNEGTGATTTLEDEPAEPHPNPVVTPPPQSPGQTTLFRPALTAGIIIAALVLGYFYWPGGDNSDIDNTNTGTIVTEPMDTVDVVPVARTEPVPDEPQATVSNDAITPAENPAREPVKDSTDWRPTKLSDTWEPAYMPRAAAPPVMATTPAPAEPPQTMARPVPPAAQPPVTAPVQRDYRAPAYGAYPQQRQPTYPPYYYR